MKVEKFLVPAFIATYGQSPPVRPISNPSAQPQLFSVSNNLALGPSNFHVETAVDDFTYGLPNPTGLV
jgi:hypothetical protein